jgi:FixJ family two-component response regulator
VTESDLEAQLKELQRIPLEISGHREKISALAARRRELAERVVAGLGPTETAKRLGISRQTLWQVLKPEQAKEIKRRSARRAVGD